jgi:hypothetical protein
MVARVCYLAALMLLPTAPAPGQVMAEDFSNGLAGWWVEGGERAWIEDGRFHLKAGGGVATAWWKRALPADFVLTLEARVISSPSEANNINLFLCYSDPSGKPLYETRAARQSADYGLYHKLNGYIITFLNDATAEGGRNADGSTKARVRIRKNPGFRLLKETFTGTCRAGVTYRLAVTKKGGTIRFAVDGETLLEAVDEQPWTGGAMGLRTFATYLWWDNIRVEPLPE